jgi:hypothetical protein
MSAEFERGINEDLPFIRLCVRLIGALTRQRNDAEWLRMFWGGISRLTRRPPHDCIDRGVAFDFMVMRGNHGCMDREDYMPSCLSQCVPADEYVSSGLCLDLLRASAPEDHSPSLPAFEIVGRPDLLSDGPGAFAGIWFQARALDTLTAM